MNNPLCLSCSPDSLRACGLCPACAAEQAIVTAEIARLRATRPPGEWWLSGGRWVERSIPAPSEKPGTETELLDF